jgi:hypothetical protein
MKQHSWYTRHAQRAMGLHRRGSVYVFVLGAAMLIATTGILATTLQSARLVRQRSMDATVSVDAEHAAAVEYAIETFENDPSGSAWRPFSRLVVNAPAMLGTSGTSHVLSLTDPADDNLRTVNLVDDVQLRVESTVGASKRATQLTFGFTQTPLSALSNALIRESEHNGTITVIGTKATAVSLPGRDAAYDANAQTGVTPAQLNAAILAMNSTVPGEVQEPSSELFAYYRSIGTLITLSAATTYDRVLFSPTSNPAGTGLNARGIYVIDCNNKGLRLSDSRVLGTLVIINPHTTSRIGPKVSMSPASADLPTLLVDGEMFFDLEDDDLREWDADRNFNPSGAPYLGETDSDESDRYPSRIRGLTYVSVKAKIGQNSAFEGVLWVNGEVHVSMSRTLTVRWAPLTAPIPGFTTASSMFVEADSVQRLAP